MIPQTTQMQPKPVYARMIRRMNGDALADPTDDEMRDAIKVLATGMLTPGDLLYREAERIFAEGSAAQLRALESDGATNDGSA